MASFGLEVGYSPTTHLAESTPESAYPVSTSESVASAAVVGAVPAPIAAAFSGSASSSAKLVANAAAKAETVTRAIAAAGVQLNWDVRESMSS